MKDEKQRLFHPSSFRVHPFDATRFFLVLVLVFAEAPLRRLAAWSGRALRGFRGIHFGSDKSTTISGKTIIGGTYVDDFFLWFLPLLDMIFTSREVVSPR